MSRVSTVTDGNNHTTHYTYDNRDRVKTVTYDDSSVITYNYDENGNITSVVDNTGTTGFSYDENNRQTQKSLPGSVNVTTSFDAVGNLASLTTPAGTTSYSYNAVNLLSTLTEPGNAQTTFSYNNNYQRTQTSYPNGVTQTVSYDGAGRVNTIQGKHGSTTFASYTYTHVNSSNGQGELVNSVTDLSGTTFKYGYDTLSRLTSAKQYNSGNIQTDEYDYQYDAAGNRTQFSHGLSSPSITNYSYNAANELTSSTGVSSYSYDGNGNLTGWTGGSAFSYNDKNQTASIGSNSYTYSGPDQNERVSANGTNYIYSGLGCSCASTAAGTTYYIRDNTQNLIDERTPGGTYYYLFDGEGSIVGLTDSSGNLVNNERYQYDPYGNLINTLSSSVLQANPWRYAGGYFDNSTGLYKYGIRYYAPSLGRWTQRTPVGGSLAETVKANPYVYAGDNPVNFVDPSGAFCISSTKVLVALGLILTVLAAGFFILGVIGTDPLLDALLLDLSYSQLANIFGIITTVIAAVSFSLPTFIPEEKICI